MQTGLPKANAGAEAQTQEPSLHFLWAPIIAGLVEEQCPAPRPLSALWVPWGCETPARRR